MKTKKKILITGANGFVGSRFAKRLLNVEEYEITCVSRQHNYHGITRIDEIISDINDIDNYKKALLDSEYVIWFAAFREHFANEKVLIKNNVVPIQKVKTLLQQSKKLKCFIYISSISAVENQKYSQHPISEITTPNPSTPYGKSKLLAEQTLEDSNLPWSVIRLPFMYGSNFAPHSHLWFWNYLAKIPSLRFEAPKSGLSLLHVNDLASILHKIIDQNIDISNRKIFISDGNIYSVDSILNLIDEQANKRIAINLSSHTERFYRLIPLANKKYWSRIFFDKNFFSVYQSDIDIVKSFSYLTIADGISETYYKHEPEVSSK